MTVELRCGRWQDALADVDPVDSLISDPPYSARTHEGFRSGGVSAGTVSEQPGLIEYAPLVESDVDEFVASWVPRVCRWFVLFGDHITASWWARALVDAGLYVFAPVPWIRRDAPPRFSGDGPQRSAEWLTIARPRIAERGGSRPGHYLVNRVEGAVDGALIPGHKNLNGMRAVVRHYSRPGDLVVDPYAGTGTTLHAAAIEGRRSIGAERDPGTYALAKKRLERGYTPNFLVGDADEDTEVSG